MRVSENIGRFSDSENFYQYQNCRNFTKVPEVSEIYYGPEEPTGGSREHLTEDEWSRE